MFIQIFAIIASLAAIGFAFYLVWRLLKYSSGEGKMVEIAAAIREGAEAGRKM